MPQISVIIPIYNAGRYLRQCLESIAGQTFRDFEVIMVNDGSTDDSAGICKDFCQRDARFLYINKENGGVSSARNRGLKEAKGEFVSFIDADDELFPSSLETLVGLMEGQAAVSIAMGTYHETSENGDVLYSEKREFAHLLDKVESISIMFDTSKYHYQGYLWNKLFRLATIREHAISFDETLHYNEDRTFVIQYLTCMPGAMHITSKPVYRYYQRGTSAMHQTVSSFSEAIYDDFNSSIFILNMLKQKQMPRSIINLARDRILDSYDFIRHRMKGDSIINAKAEKKALRSRAIEEAGGTVFFIGNRVRRFLSKQLTHITKRPVYIKAM